MLLHHYMGEIDGAFRAWGIPQGGTGGISNAIASAARALGAEIRTEAPVAQDRRPRRPGDRGRPRDRARRSPRLGRPQLGRRPADVPRRSSSPGVLDPTFEAEVRRFKFRGSSGKVNLAVDAPARLHLPARRRASTSAARSLQRRRSTTWSGPTTTPSTATGARRPYIDMIIPTLVDPTMAPPGKHVISCFVQYAPYHLAPEPRDLGRQPRGVRRHRRSTGSPSSPRTSATSSSTARS